MVSLLEALKIQIDDQHRRRRCSAARCPGCASRSRSSKAGDGWLQPGECIVIGEAADFLLGIGVLLLMSAPREPPLAAVGEAG